MKQDIFNLHDKVGVLKEGNYCYAGYMQVIKEPVSSKNQLFFFINNQKFWNIDPQNITSHSLPTQEYFKQKELNRFFHDLEMWMVENQTSFSLNEWIIAFESLKNNLPTTPKHSTIIKDYRDSMNNTDIFYQTIKEMALEQELKYKLKIQLAEKITQL